MDQLNRVDVDTFRNQDKTPIVLVLDNVRSLHNVGSAFRTADAFAIEKIMLCGITGELPHREIEKTAQGATQSIEWIHLKDSHDAIQLLQTEGYQILIIETDQKQYSIAVLCARPQPKICDSFWQRSPWGQ